MRVNIYDDMVVIVATLVIVLAMAQGAFATPFIWVDTVNGSDTSTNYLQPTDPVRTYARAIQLGADGDTLGVKVKPGSALPSEREAFIINSRKPDRVRVEKPKQQVVAGREVPMGEVETSAEAGLKITTDYVWITISNQNGLQEVLREVTTTVEEY